MANVKKVTPRRNVKKKPAKKKTVKPKPTGYLGQVTTEAEEAPWLMLVHGVGGVGKTEFAANLPTPVFICDDQETGIDDLKRANRVPRSLPVFPYVDSWQMLQDVLRELIDKADDVEYETVVLDSLTGMQNLCFRHHCDEAFEGDWSAKGFFAYQQGPRNAVNTIWPDFLSLLGELRKQGYNVVLIAHSQVKMFSNPEGSDFERWVPYLDKEVWAVTYRFMEVVLFANYDVDVEKKNRQKAKAKGGDNRSFYTEWSAAYDAKNRWGLPMSIDMGDSGKDSAKNFIKEASRV